MKEVIAIQNDEAIYVSELDDECVTLSSVLEEVMEFKTIKEAEKFAYENIDLGKEGYGSKFEIVKIRIDFETNTVPYTKVLRKLN